MSGKTAMAVSTSTAYGSVDIFVTNLFLGPSARCVLLCLATSRIEVGRQPHFFSFWACHAACCFSMVLSMILIILSSKLHKQPCRGFKHAQGSTTRGMLGHPNPSMQNQHPETSQLAIMKNHVRMNQWLEHLAWCCYK